jgi:hypothetical protein
MSKKKRIAVTVASTIAVAVMVLGVLIPAPKASAQDAKPSLAITQVNLENSTIEISNHGSSEVDPNGIILCNFPAYAPITGASMIPAGGKIIIDTSAAGVALDPVHGEIGLYLTPSYEDPTQLISYMEYGNAGHQRSSVAIAAGIWSEGFGPGGGGILNASTNNPTSPGEWASTAGSAAQGATNELALTGTDPALILVGSGALLSGLTLVAVSRRRLAALG